MTEEQIIAGACALAKRNNMDPFYCVGGIPNWHHHYAEAACVLNAIAPDDRLDAILAYAKTRLSFAIYPKYKEHWQRVISMGTRP